MRLLANNFKRDGFAFEVVERVGNAAIYRKKRPEHSEWTYEVGLIRQNDARTIGGKALEAGESWPSSEEWGVRGWTYCDLSRARVRLAILTLPNNQNGWNPAGTTKNEAL